MSKVSKMTDKMSIIMNVDHEVNYNIQRLIVYKEYDMLVYK